MMELYGPLYRHQNEGRERFNDRLTGRKKRHSQNGGACNRGAELCASRGATVGKCDSIGTWAGRSLCTADCNPRNTTLKNFTQPAARRGAGGFAATRVTVTPRPAGGSAATSAFFSFAPGLRPCRRFFT